MSRSSPLDNSAREARARDRTTGAALPEAHGNLRSRLGRIADPFALLEGMFVHSPVPYMIFGSDGHPVASNAAFQALFGREPPPEYNVRRDEIAARLGFADLVRRAFAGEAVETPAVWYDPKELRHIDGRGGNRVAIACSFFPLRDGNGEVAYVAAAYKDVTSDLEARERAEVELARLKALADEKDRLANALRESDQRLRDTLEAAEVGTWEWDIAANEVTWSANVERIHGLQPGSFDGTYEGWYALVHPLDRAVMAAKIAATLETHAPYAAEFRSLRADGSTAWQSTRGYLVRDDAGRPRLLRGVVFDITARRSAEEALKMPGHVLENMTEAVTLADENGYLLYTNPAADKMFGYDGGELLGKHVTILNAYPVEENARIVADVIAHLHEHREWIGQWANQRKDGSRFKSRARITVLEEDEGGPRWLCTQEDITDELDARERADALAESLRARERQLRLITDSLPALVNYMGPDKRFRFANSAYMTWFGVEPESLIGKHARDLLGETGFRQIEAHMDRALAGENIQYEREVTLADGRVIYTHMNYVPDKDEHGKTQGYVAMIHDMTHRHRAELAVQAERKRLHDILMSAPAAISLRSGADGAFTFANPMFEHFSGGRALLGKTTRQAYSEPTAKAFIELIDRVYATKKRVSGTEMRAQTRNRDGFTEERFFNITYQPLLDEEGRIDSVVSFAVDVTEQVEARQRSERLTAALRESEARYRGFVNQSTEGIWRIELAEPIAIDAPEDEQLALLFRSAHLAECNDAMARMHGFGHGEALVGRRMLELLAPEEPLNHEFLRAFIAEGYRLEAVESQKRGPDGRLRFYRNGLVGVVEGGRLRRAWGTQRDVTAEVEAREQAEAGNRAKDEFLALLGHELRNPLSPILTALELMKLGDAEAFPKERAIIERQVEHVVRLVDDLLDVSRITRGKVSLERRRVDVAQVIGRAIELSSPLLEQRTHRLAVRIEPRLTVEGDPLRLSQVFANLLTNAAKYTPRGGDIAVEAVCVDGVVRVCVRDTGIGIRSEMLPRVFDLFAQERQALDRSEGGLGLGLSIVKSLVELHGGEVEARSEGRGRGSEFRVSLPLSEEAYAVKPDPQRVRRERADGLRVLVVDDNEDAAGLLAQALATLGQVVRVAHDGPSALKTVETFTPDLALLDIGLPAMDGYELARRLRAIPELARVRLVAVTGYGQARDREAAGDAGFHEHVVKPVNMAMIEGVLSRVDAGGRNGGGTLTT